MRPALRLLASLAPLALVAAGCEISPVVSTPEPLTGRFADCERAAEAYCEHVEGVSDADRERCVADYAYRCVANAD